MHWAGVSSVKIYVSVADAAGGKRDMRGSEVTVSASQRLYWFLPSILLVIGFSVIVVMAGLESGRNASRSQFASTLPRAEDMVVPEQFDLTKPKTASLGSPVVFSTEVERRVDGVQRSRWVLKTDSMGRDLDNERFGLKPNRKIAFNFARGQREPSRVFSQPFLVHVRQPGADEFVIQPATAYVGVTDLSERRQAQQDKLRAAEIQCLAQAIYFEARGEPTLGQIAVANVIMNRVKSSSYPDDICGVVFQNQQRHLACQFTFACDGRSDKPRKDKSWAKSQHIAEQVIDGKKLMRSMRKATNYHATYVSPKWSRKLSTVKRIGRHIFYTSPRTAPVD